MVNCILPLWEHIYLSQYNGSWTLIFRRRKQKFQKLPFNGHFRHEMASRVPWLGRTCRNESETYRLDFPMQNPQQSKKQGTHCNEAVLGVERPRNCRFPRARGLLLPDGSILPSFTPSFNKYFQSPPTCQTSTWQSLGLRNQRKQACGQAGETGRVW